MRGLGTSEDLTHGDAGGPHQAGHGRWQPGRVRGRRWGRAHDRGRFLGRVGGRGTRTVGRARRRTGRPNRRAVRTSPRAWHRSDARVGDPAPGGKTTTGGQHGPPHQARGPDVAVDPALVAKPVGEPGLAQKLVELGAGAVRGPGCGRRPSGPRPPRPRCPSPTLRSGWPGAGRRATRGRRARRCRIRRGVGTRRSRGSRTRPLPLTSEGAQRIEHLGGVVARLEEFERSGVVPDGGDQPLELGGPAGGHGRRARRRPSSSAGGSPVQPPTWTRKSPVGIMAPAVNRMCWAIIGRVVVTASCEVVGQFARRRARRDRPPGCPGALRSKPACMSRPTRRSCSRQSFFSKTSSARWKRWGISSSGAGSMVL